jgi:hypothetical protein
MRPDISVSRRINAPTDVLYGIIADYRNSHPRILPPAFTGLEVEQGGIGAGTIIRFGMRAFGTTRTARASVTEPEPGRVLVETMLDGDPPIVTTFTVDPVDGAGAADVRISTRFPTKPGLLGAIEHAISSRFLTRVYRELLQLLERIARKTESKT